jgi:MoxR-like ATPase
MPLAVFLLMASFSETERRNKNMAIGMFSGPDSRKTIEMAGYQMVVNPIFYEAVNAICLNQKGDYTLALGEHEDQLFAECRYDGVITMVVIDIKKKNLRQFKIDAATKHASLTVFGDFGDKIAIAALMIRYLETEGSKKLTNAIGNIYDFTYNKTSKITESDVNKLALQYGEVEGACLEISSKKSSVFGQVNNSLLMDLNYTQVLAGQLGPSKVICGKFEGFVKAEASPEDINMDDFKTKYVLDPSRKFTDEEKERLIEIPDWYRPSSNALSVTRKVYRSFQRPDNQHIINILFEGPNGTGKTADAKYGVAAPLGLPYSKVTCFSDMDSSHVIGQFLPVEDEIKLPFEEPDPDMIELDPAGCYEQVTGKTLTEDEALTITPEAVYDVMEKTLKEFYESDEGKREPHFVFFASEIANAFEKGWVCEIQEPTCVADAAVLMALNSALERNGVLNLPTRTIKRHPMCIMIMTTNRNYEGCRPLNQALRDRFNICRKVELPSNAEMVSRLKASTGCDNTSFLNSLVESVVSLNGFLKDRGINATISLRSMQDFVSDLMDGFDTLETIRETIVYKLTTDDDEVAEIESFIELSTPLMSICL